MRCINTDELEEELPEGWVERAQQALEEIRAAEPANRAQLLQQKAELWRELKEILASVSHDKCWYCESLEVRSDNAVDHFRPKGRVEEADHHEGYWWLAFDFRNYRYSCTFCNSRRKDRKTSEAGGKHDHFPLMDESKRSYAEGDDCSFEQPALLDPVSSTDPTLLWFEPDGRAVERYGEDQNQVFNKRAQTSIELYHLNETKVKTKRRDLHSKLLRLIKQTDIQFRSVNVDNNAAVQALEAALRTIGEIIHPKAEHSAAARAMLIAYRAEHPWIEPILATHQ